MNAHTTGIGWNPARVLFWVPKQDGKVHDNPRQLNRLLQVPNIQPCMESHSNITVCTYTSTSAYIHRDTNPKMTNNWYK